MTGQTIRPFVIGVSTRPWIVDDALWALIESLLGLGKLRYVVEQSFALLHQFKVWPKKRPEP